MTYYIAKFSGKLELSRIGPFNSPQQAMCLLDACIVQEQMMEPMRLMRPDLCWYRNISFEIQETRTDGSITTCLRFEND